VSDPDFGLELTKKAEERLKKNEQQKEKDNTFLEY
jgi:hypothetical protein